MRRGQASNNSGGSVAVVSVTGTVATSTAVLIAPLTLSPSRPADGHRHPLFEYTYPYAIQNDGPFGALPRDLLSQPSSQRIRLPFSLLHFVYLVEKIESENNNKS